MVLDVACFAEAERLYMLVRDTSVRGRLLTALVLPDVLVSGAGMGPVGAASTAILLNAGQSEQSPHVCAQPVHTEGGARAPTARGLPAG